MFVSFLRGLRGKARSEVGPLQPCSGLRLLRGWTHHKSVRAYTQGRRHKLDLNNRGKQEKYILTNIWEACCLWQKCLCVDVKYKLVGSRRRRRRRRDDQASSAFSSSALSSSSSSSASSPAPPWLGLGARSCSRRSGWSERCPPGWGSCIPPTLAGQGSCRGPTWDPQASQVGIITILFVRSKGNHYT